MSASAFIDQFGVLRRQRIRGAEDRLARRAEPLALRRPSLIWAALQDRLLAAAEAISAQPMGWLAGAHTWLLHVHETSARQVDQLITRCLLGPVFQAHNLLFELRYAAVGRRMRLLSREEALLRFQDDALEGNSRFVQLGPVAYADHRSQHILSRLKACHCGADFGDTDHSHQSLGGSRTSTIGRKGWGASPAPEGR